DVPEISVVSALRRTSSVRGVRPYVASVRGVRPYVASAFRRTLWAAFTKGAFHVWKQDHRRSHRARRDRGRSDRVGVAASVIQPRIHGPRGRCGGGPDARLPSLLDGGPGGNLL